MSDSLDAYAEYESSLSSLQAVPDAVARDLADARRSYGTACKAADDALQRESLRLAGLRRNAEARYGRAVAALETRDIRLPAQVRPDADLAGDDTSMRRALDGLSAALASVDARLREDADATRRAQKEASRRAVDAQLAADALRARQEKLRAERAKAAEDDRRRATEAAAQGRRRSIIVVSAAAVLVVAAIVGVLLIFNR